MPPLPKESSRSNLLPFALGATIVAGFFLPWTDFFGTISGWSHATDGGEPQLFLVPLAGLALVAAVLLAPRYVPAAAIAVGGGITAWFGYHLAVLCAAAYGWGITMVVGGAVAAIAGALVNKPSLSAVGGFAMIGGFFAPWIDPGHISGFELARANGLGAIAIAAWIVPIGGALAAYGAGKRAQGRKLCAFGGLAGIGAIAYLTYRLLGGVLGTFMGWGYFLVVGCAIAAFVVGIVRVRRRPTPTQL
jgi:hypothetical protein